MAQQDISQATAGLNMDASPSQRKAGELSYANNAVTQGFDGESVIYQMEQSNEYYAIVPEGFKVVGGPFNITQIQKVIFFLGKEDGSDSQIGYIENGTGVYTTVIQDSCLSFSVNYPIHQIVVKSVNCSTQIYWTDNNQQRRFIDFDNLPWKEIANPDNAFKPIKLVGQVDCNKLLVQPHFSVPTIHGERELIGGVLKMGVYQATVQYADILGNGLTDFYNPSNPFSIHKATEGTALDASTDKAIEYLIDNLDTSGLYDFYNIAIIKTVNGIVSPELVAKGLPITGKQSTYTYTGSEQDAVRLSILDMFQKKAQYYDKAGGVFSVDDVIGWYDLTSSKAINYQQIANKIKIYWETHKIPYNNFEAYKNGVNTADYRSFMRDEVYPLELVPILRTGEQKEGFPIPARLATPNDLAFIDSSNKDGTNTLTDPCDAPEQKPRWQVYNTASVIGYSQEYLDYQGEDSCYKGAYQYGEMAYWESTETYPNNPIIWGDLAGKPIRHHKFPDSAVTHIHDDNPTGDKSFVHSIFPIGIRIEGLKEAIEASDLSQEEKDNIIGFKIIRGNRANNKSVIAKGMFNNVGKYTYFPETEDDDAEQTYYYPNYPFNDLRPDPYFTNNRLKNHSGYRPDKRIKGFNTDESKNRFVFYSPDTQFFNPAGIDSGQLKLETIEYGQSYGHFVPVDENAKYLLLNKNGYKIAYGVAAASVINGKLTYETPWSYGVGADFAPENMPTTFQSMLDLLEKILPKLNYGYSFNSIGYYNKSYAVPNDGNKVRNISFGKYLKSEYETIEGGNLINNYQREGSVYLNTSDTLLYPHQYSNVVPQDTSRYNLSSYMNNNSYEDFFPYFKQNPNIVLDTNIYESIIDTTYGGSDVINIQYTGNSSVPVTGDIIDYYQVITTGKKKVASLEVIDYGYNNSGSAFDGDFTAILIDGDINSITIPLQLDSSDHSGSAEAKTVYKNPTPQNAIYEIRGQITVVPGVGITTPTYGFDTLVTQSYQSYVITRQSAIDDVTTKVRSILAGITSEEDVETLNVINPSGNNDFYKLVAYNAYLAAYARFQQRLEREFSPDKIREANISSYYGSIKRILPSQWGAISSYERIDTGFYSPLYDEDGSIKSSFPTVFGGDTFINRHAFKIKLPFFEYNTVEDNNQADIEYDKIATLTYPMFWLSTRPEDIRSNLAAFVEKKARNIIANGQTLNAFQIMVAGAAAVSLSFEVLKEILAGLAVKNVNLDNAGSTSLYEQGLMYLFAYGIPYYFCESEVNTDNRHATNSREGNFYPNVAGEIPDDWVQEANVSIVLPEQFNYNVTYSKQNKENYYTRLRADFDPEKNCFYRHNNRVVWSDKSSLEETKNNWLTYRPANYFDFPKKHGELVSLDTIQNRTVLARFEDKSQLYNAMLRIDTSSPEAAYLGNDSLFSGTPAIDLSTSGYGSQNKFILKTEQGTLFLDAKRGQVALLRGQELVDIGRNGMDKWFRHFLAFFISKVGDINTDNHLKGVGITGVYDSLYKRIIITKKDYEPLVNGISYNDNGEFILNGNIISVTDNNYFCDRSWTLSYSFITNTWTSFHSYTPNYYVEHAKYFQSGRNGSTADVWNHNTTYTSYHSFYGTTYPYILEYPINSQTGNDQILQGIKDYTRALRFTDYETYTAPKETYYFNKVVISNDQQCTGVLELEAKRGLSAYGKYPKYGPDSKTIQVTKSDNYFNFNTFWNITKDVNQPIWNKTCSFQYTNRTLNMDNLDYSNKAYTKAPIRAKESLIRLIKDNESDVRLVSRFVITETMNSHK